MPKPVFISYSRRTSLEAAAALQAALGDGLVFRDEVHLEPGQAFPEALFDAEVGAQVVVCLLDEAYTDSAFCQAELEIALSPYWGRESVAETDLGVVLVLPEGRDYTHISRLPPCLKELHWPTRAELDRVAALVRATLGRPQPRSIAATLGPRAMLLLKEQLRQIAVMPPRQRPSPEVFTAGLPAMPVGAFYGRAALLAEIHRRLEQESEIQQVALVAPGGAGKTRLALEYLWRYGTVHYPGGLVWIDAASEGTRDQQLHAVLGKLVPGLPPLPELLGAGVDLAHRIAQVLEERAARGLMLWVVDNLPEPAPGAPPESIAHWAPVGAAPVAVLATSRMRCHPAEINLFVAALERPDAIRLLEQGVAGEGLPGNIADQIAASVGDWPLALELLSRSFQAGALTPTEFLEHHRRTGVAQLLDEAMETLRDQVPAGALRGVSESLLLSYERLDPEAQRLAVTLAHFGPEPIPGELLAAMGDLARPKPRSALLARNLATGNSAQSYGQIHPVVGDFLRSQDRDGAGLSRAVAAMAAAVAALDPDDPAAWGLQDPLAPHARALLRQPPAGDPGPWFHAGYWYTSLLLAQANFPVARTALLALHAHATADGDRSRLWALRFQCLKGRLARQQGLLAEGQNALQDAVAGLEQLHGPEHPALLEALRPLSALLRRRGEFDASRQVAERCLHIASTRLGLDHPEALRAEQLIGEAIWSTGDAGAAQALYEKLIPRLLERYGADYPDVLEASGNYCLALRRQGEVSRALEVLTDTAARAKRLYGELHPLALRHEHNLALLIRQFGDFATARDMHKTAHAARRRSLGPSHPETLRSLHALALNLWSLQDLQGAAEGFREALAGQVEVLGESHPDTMRTLANLGMVLKALGRNDEAVALLTRALELHEARWGMDYPDTRQVRDALDEIRAHAGVEGPRA
ncbi:MAG TPA: toll/interleukin-1 receptor domain-containing protein [bacterium]|nr:toll/interleukin-1 receptor domain-containing protein [bacterium]